MSVLGGWLARGFAGDGFATENNPWRCGADIMTAGSSGAPSSSVFTITTTAPKGKLLPGQVVTFSVTFHNGDTDPSPDVMLVSGGVPALLLSNGGVATYAGGSGTGALTFTYTVGDGQVTGDLQVAGLALNGAQIADATVTDAIGSAPLQPVVDIVYVTAMTTGDVNGDGIPDVIVSEGGPTLALLGDGTGKIKSLLVPLVGSANALAIADLNHDGRVEIIGAQSSGGTIVSTPAGAFLAYIPSSDVPRDIAVTDWNGDGKPDVVRVGATVEVMYGDGAMHFAAPVVLPSMAGPLQVTVADLNGDGLPDLVITGREGSLDANAVSASDVEILLNAGGGSYATPLYYALPGRPMKIAVADLNGDGKPDLVGEYFLAYGLGDGTFTPAKLLAGSVMPMAPAAVADVNGDGRLDLVDTQGNVQYGTDNGQFGPVVVGAFSDYQFVYTAVADFNADGRADIVSIGWDGPTIYTSVGMWSNPTTVAAGAITGAAGQDTRLSVRDPLVDDAYYDAWNPDVAAAQFDPSQHYDQYGWKEGRNPDAWFDTKYYLNHNPDVAASGMNPLLHYELYGWKEGRNPSAAFDTRDYLAADPSLAASGTDPLLSFLTTGQAQGLVPFAVPDGPVDPLVDTAYYFAHNPDVLAARVDPGVHYAAYGWQEGRNPDAWFDTGYYLSHNPDVAAAHIDPLLHYETFGWMEGRDPSAQFSTSKYLAAYADVKAAGMNPLLHYVEYGQAEGRQAFAV